MSIVFVLLGWTFPFTTPSAIELSVCSGVGDCLYPISSRMMRIYTASCAIMYSAANSASVAEDMTCLMICAMLSTAPLLWGTDESVERKKCPPALLRAFGSLR